MTSTPAAPGWLRRHRSLLVDLVLAVVLVGSAVVSLNGSAEAVQPWSTLVGAVWMAFIGFRSTATLLAVLGMSAGCLAYAWLPGAPQEGGLWSFVALLVIAFTAGSRLSGRRRAVGCAALLVCAYVLQIVTGLRPAFHQNLADTFVALLVLVGGPFVAGLLLQGARRQTLELRRLKAELENEREAHAAAAAAEERTRIARELHDVISHSVSVMVVQAGAAELQLPPDSSAREQLHAVRQTGKQALVELRRQLGVLRTPEPATGPVAIPTLADLRQLAGPGVAVEVDEALLGAVSPGLAQTVFRLVQESLTNARRHASGAPVRVRVRPSGDALEVDVTNGPGRPLADLRSSGTGLGLRGMAERVELYGGRLATGPTADGGWAVSARLPSPAVGVAS